MFRFSLFIIVLKLRRFFAKLSHLEAETHKTDQVELLTLVLEKESRLSCLLPSLSWGTFHKQPQYMISLSHSRNLPAFSGICSVCSDATETTLEKMCWSRTKGSRD